MKVPAGRCVVIAEDDRAVRHSLERTLRLEGFDVTAVRNGAEAVDLCTTSLPDLLILDVMMPEMDGVTACRTLRPQYPELPILMLTARHEVGDRVAGLEAGADDYLVKPMRASSSSRACEHCCAAAACQARTNCCATAISNLIPPPASRGAVTGTSI